MCIWGGNACERLEGKSLGFCGTSLDVENFLKGKCVLVSSGNIIYTCRNSNREQLRKNINIPLYTSALGRKSEHPDVFVKLTIFFLVQSAYVISVKWDKIFPKSGLEVWYELYRGNLVLREVHFYCISALIKLGFLD